MNYMYLVYRCIFTIAIFVCRQTPEEITAQDLAVAVPGECLFPELCAENEEASHEEEKGILVYTDSSEGRFIVRVFVI